LEWFSRGKRTIGGFFDVLCKEIVKYYENDEEFMAYVDAHSYLALRLKVRFTKDYSSGEYVDKEFFFHQFRNRDYLIQTLQDVPKIIKKQFLKFEADISDFVRKCSNLTLQGPLWVSLDLFLLSLEFTRLEAIFLFMTG
jgi:hypothetical protein